MGKSPTNKPYDTTVSHTLTTLTFHTNAQTRRQGSCIQKFCRRLSHVAVDMKKIETHSTDQGHLACNHTRECESSLAVRVGCQLVPHARL